VDWVNQVEEFLRQYPNIIATISAVSTLAAVIVSLAIALWSQRATRTQLTARIYVAHIVTQSIPVDKPYVFVAITNKGSMTLSIPPAFLGWRIPLCWIKWQFAVPIDATTKDRLVAPRSYPVSVAPRTTEFFHVTTPELLKSSLIESYQSCPWRVYLFRCFVKFVVITADGHQFKVEIAPEIQRIIDEIQQS
jgi:hypothetical protein